jgi:hypothetical protein
MIWVLVDRLRLGILLAAVLMPFIGLGLGIRWHRRRPDRSAETVTAGSTIGCLTGVFAAAIPLYVGMCTPPPGEGVQAWQGRARGAIVMRALDEYHATAHVFPDSLQELVPRWLPDSALVGPARRGPGAPFVYARIQDGYTLSFRYVGPGMNTCEISSASRRWRCGGYF